MKDSPNDLKTLIAQRVAAKLGQVWTPFDFLDLGRQEAVKKALQRLVTAGTLRRVDRGLYDQPRRNTLTGKPTVPDYQRVIQALARRDQTRMLVDGMTAANDLGLSDAVPGRITVQTDARLEPIKLGKQTIAFRLTAPSKLYWADRPAMRVVQALFWLRDSLADTGDRDRILRRLSTIFADPEQGHVIAADLAKGITTLPAWMQDFVRPILLTDAGDGDGDGHHDNRHHPGSISSIGAAADDDDVHHHPQSVTPRDDAVRRRTGRPGNAKQ